NLCWRLAALAPDERIEPRDLEGLGATAADETGAGAGPAEWDAALGDWARRRLEQGARALHAEARDRMEQALFEAALERTGGRRGEAAARLGVGRNTLTRKLAGKRVP